ncbi:sel1 repeat family protein [Myxococcota bacterium]|nr:sel1 repeat family protein [Myxococcota bacterium]MBU1381090.1 sel1 repeat family protein [Myxococcota bacterium]MBU1498627.1 sel1 repeat family protein [Myxococcota bacterium]
MKKILVSMSIITAAAVTMLLFVYCDSRTSRNTKTTAGPDESKSQPEKVPEKQTKPATKPVPQVAAVDPCKAFKKINENTDLSSYTTVQLEEICKCGTVKACSRAGRLFALKENNYYNTGKMIKYLNLSCDKGVWEDCHFLGTVSEKGFDNLVPDLPKARILYKSSCEKGKLEKSCFQYHSLVFATAKNPADTYNYFSKKCREKQGESCMYMGRMLSEGRGVKRDRKEALKVFKKWCESGHHEGCIWQGKLHEEDGFHARAFQLYKDACTAAEGLGCLFGGNLLVEGKKLKKDPRRAAEMYTTGCEKGENNCCNVLGKMYQKGIDGDKPDFNLSVKFFEKSCQGRIMESCRLLAYIYETGRGVEQNFKRAGLLYDMACVMGEPIACANLGYLYEKGFGVKPDPVKAFKLYEMSCKKGEMTACNNLGHMYHSGVAVKSDSVKAFGLFEKACKSGHLPACQNVARLYELGEGVTKDLKKAVALYKKNCIALEMASCNSLAEMYKTGTGLKLDKRMAYDYYKKACFGNFAQGCTNLAMSYYLGRGTAKNVKKAIRYFEKACNAGEVTACFNLGKIYEKGRGGIKVDNKKALELYEKACRLGDSESCRMTTEKKGK